MPITITDVVNDFVCNYKAYPNDRYMSYEHCRKYFLDNRYFPAKYDFITLHLYAYLASWGMLRNSFLLRKDYLFNKPVVKILSKSEYDCLKYFNPFGPNAKNYLGSIKNLKDEINKCYGYKKDKKGKDIPLATDILVSKIILGTLGYVPAYDTNFKSGLDEYFGKEEVNKNGLKKFEESSMNVMVDFAIKNKKEIENACKELDQLSGVKGLYTPMKIIDMYFFEVGLEAKKQKNKQQTNKQNP